MQTVDFLFLSFAADPDDPQKTTDQTRRLGLIVCSLILHYFHVHELENGNLPLRKLYYKILACGAYVAMWGVNAGNMPYDLMVSYNLNSELLGFFSAKKVQNRFKYNQNPYNYHILVLKLCGSFATPHTHTHTHTYLCVYACNCMDGPIGCMHA